MTKMSTTDASKDFAGVLRRVAAAHERIVFQAGGKSVAALVPVEDLRLLEQMLALLGQYEDVADRQLVQDARREKGKRKPYDAVRKELGLDE